MLLQDLSGLRGYSVREADFELDNQVSALGGDLGEGQPLATQPLHRARLDDVAAGQGDHAPIQGGNVHSAAAQGLEGGEREREEVRGRVRAGAASTEVRDRPQEAREAL